MTNEAVTTTINDIDHFAAIVVAWHTAAVAKMKYTLQVPDGTGIGVNDEPDITLTGDVLKGFLLGIEVSLMEFEQLPFFSDTEVPAVEVTLEPVSV